MAMLYATVGTARAIYDVVPPITTTLLVAVTLLLFYSRFVHSGSVCSGDFLDAKHDSKKGYLIAQGSFVKAYASILSITIYCLWCCICFVSANETAKRTQIRQKQAAEASRLA